MWEWLEIQYHRFGVWRRVRAANPGCRVWVRYLGEGKFGYTIMKAPRTEAERQEILKEMQQYKDKKQKLRAMMSPDDRAKAEAKEAATQAAFSEEARLSRLENDKRKWWQG
jgi:formylmethanofuran dehydrogenase subunit E